MLCDFVAGGGWGSKICPSQGREIAGGEGSGAIGHADFRACSQISL
jgi:hypothetical protein